MKRDLILKILKEIEIGLTQGELKSGLRGPEARAEYKAFVLQINKVISLIEKGSNQPALLESHAIITGHRKASYGDPKIGFSNVADQWRLYLRQKHNVDVPIEAEDICWMMADLKKIRQMNSKKRDNVLDALGFLGLIELL